MAKITIDDSLCTGCGLCSSNCPEVFEVGDDGLAHVKTEKGAGCDIKEIAEQCPVIAISVK
ncbi:MAG: ferredoxin [Candidatus Omnitrophota bacterium]|nr:ferredoxin [Candidatus Omnitrophota bacterium]